MKRFRFLIIACALAVPSSLFSYEQVNVEKVILLADKKADLSLLRLDPQNQFWVLNKNLNTLQRLSEDGKPAFTLDPGKKKDILFRALSDFDFLKDGSFLVADPGLNRIALIKSETIEASSDTKKQPVFAITAQFPFQSPSCLSISHDDVIAVGSKENVIRLFSLDGLPLYDLYAPENTPMKSVTSMRFARNGVLWVLDGSRGALHRFSPDRKWLGVTDGLADAQGLAVDDYGFAYVTLGKGRWKEVNQDGKVTGTFGTKGKEPGKFSSPTGLAVMSKNKLWVVDSGNKRLQLFNVTNSDKQTPLHPEPSTRIQVRSKKQWPLLVERALMAPSGDILTYTSKKMKFTWLDPNGQVKSSFGKKGKGTKGFLSPAGMAFDKNGDLWVADEGEHALKKVSAAGDIVLTVGQKGRKEGNLKNPSFLQVRTDGSFVVVDKDNSRVQVLSPDGLFLFSIGSVGNEKGKFQTISGLAVNKDRIALIDGNRKALLFFDDKGKFLSEVANEPNRPLVWSNLTALITDSDGRFCALDSGSKRIRLFTPQGKFIGDLALIGLGLASGPNHQFLVLGEKELRLYSIDVVPNVISNLSAKDQEGDSVLSWDANLDSTLYRLYRSTDGASYTLLQTTNSLTATDSATTPGVEYQYAVNGVNVQGYEGNWSLFPPLRASKRKNMSMVGISETRFKPVFTAAFKYYVKEPIGTVVVQNNNDHAYKDVKLAISLKKYTDFATEKVIPLLESGAKLEVPITMTFNDTVLELTENTPVQADIRLSFFDDNQEKTVSQNAPLTLYSRNAISWEDKARISSFITPRDVPVLDFSRAGIKTFLALLKSTTIPKPLAKSALFLESLAALGVSYVPDPKTPYAQASGHPDTLDYVQFPRETLRQKSGDCDDTTALLSALLESIGVETALVDTPTHIFVMANLEISDPDLLGFPQERFVLYKGTYWVPIETTQLSKTFMESWQAAAANVKTAQEAKTIDFIRVVDASEKYPPITLVEKDAGQPAFPAEKLEKTFPALLKSMEEERYKNLVGDIKQQIKDHPDDKMLEVRLGMIYVEGGQAAEGEAVFSSLITDASIDVQAAAKNNLGNLAYLKSDYKTAAKFYDEASILSSDDGGILVNKARTAWKLNDNESAKKYLEEAKKTKEDWREFAGDIPAELCPK